MVLTAALFQRFSLIRSFKCTNDRNNSCNLKLLQASNKTILKLCLFSCFSNSSLEIMLQENAQNPNICNWLNIPFTFNDLSRVLSSVQEILCSRLDQIDYSIIYNFPPEYLEHLLGIFHDIFKFWDSWCDSLVVLIPKPRSTAVRSISLISCFAKFKEWLIYSRLVW